MNSRSKILALVLFMFSAVAFANAPVRMAVISDATRGIYKVVYKNAEVGKVKVSIFNSARELVFTETLANVDAFVRPYNFSNLTQGEYTIVIEDKNGKSEEKINYYFKKVESAVEVSKIANEENKFLLSVENKETDLIQVRILDADSNVLHEQTMTVHGKFSVVYNLNKVKGALTFQITGSNGKMTTIDY